MVNIFKPDDTTAPSKSSGDAFGRMRVSSPIIQSIFNPTLPSFDRLSTIGVVEGNGSVNPTNDNGFTLTATNNGTRSLVRARTRTAAVYQGGKSLLTCMSFNMLTYEGAGSFKRVGYFYTPPSGLREGLYLEQDDQGVWNFVISKLGVETKIPQSSWNIDKFDGTDEQDAINKERALVFAVAFEWLSVGDIIFGFYVDAKFTPAHQVVNTNNLTNNYMSTANLFPTYEVESVGAGNDASMLVYCASVINEGSVDTIGISYPLIRVIRNTYNTRTPAGSFRPLLVFRLKSNNLNSRVKVTGLSVTVSSNTRFYAFILKDVTFSGGYIPTYISDSTQAIEYDNDPDENITIRDISGGALSPKNFVLASAGTSTSDEATTNVNSIEFLGSDFDNTAEVWCLAITASTTNETVSSAYVNIFEQA